ncbi:DUF4157 domain-containing protein, partial [Actinokineospora guangxiensis]
MATAGSQALSPHGGSIPVTTDSPVPTTVAGPVSRALGVDLSHVQVRRGEAVADEAATHSARAFTRDAIPHIPDSAGPLDSTDTAPLLAHELTHAAQQRHHGGALPTEGTTEWTDLENEAVAVEKWIASGATTAPPLITGHLPTPSATASPGTLPQPTTADPDHDHRSPGAAPLLHPTPSATPGAQSDPTFTTPSTHNHTNPSPTAHPNRPTPAPTTHLSLGPALSHHTTSAANPTSLPSTSHPTPGPATTRLTHPTPDPATTHLTHPTPGPATTRLTHPTPDPATTHLTHPTPG